MRRENRRPLALVVDDEANTRRVARRMLEHAGYDVIEAFNGEDALRFADPQLPIDILVADVQMPVMNGDEMARRFRAVQPELKVLYVTGFAEQLFEHRPLLRQGEAFLDKPFSCRGLVEAVSLLLFGRLDQMASADAAVDSRKPRVSAQQLVWQ